MKCIIEQIRRFYKSEYFLYLIALLLALAGEALIHGG